MSDQINQEAPLNNRKKNALMRYIFVLFAVAFLLILLTFFMQLRDSNQTISDLVSSNASALQNAEKLQEENRILAETLEMLESERDAQDVLHQERILEMGAQLDTSEDIKDALIADSATMENMVKDTLRGYESLLSAENSLSAGDIESAKDQLPVLESYLHLMGNQGNDRYENLLIAIELAENPVEVEE